MSEVIYFEPNNGCELPARLRITGPDIVSFEVFESGDWNHICDYTGLFLVRALRHMADADLDRERHTPEGFAKMQEISK